MDAADITEFDFSSYEQIMNRLVSLSDIVGSESMREIISGFGWLGAEELKVPMGYVDSYLSILESANTWMEMPERSEMIACLHKVKEVQAEFESLFQEFDAGNYEAAKEFLVKDSYLQIRDAFINGTMQYWDGATYIPVSREYVIIKWKDGKCSFSFPNYDDNENTAGESLPYGEMKCWIMEYSVPALLTSRQRTEKIIIPTRNILSAICAAMCRRKHLLTMQ